MSVVKDEIHKMLRDNKISEQEAHKLILSAGEPQVIIRKKGKASWFHIVWLALIFIILIVIYVNVFRGTSHIDLNNSLIKIKMLTGDPEVPATKLKMGLGDVSVSQPQSEKFKKELIDKINSYRVEFLHGLFSQFKSGPLHLSRFTFLIDFESGGRLINFMVKDSGGRKLSVNKNLRDKILNWDFTHHQIQKNFRVSIPVEIN